MPLGRSTSKNIRELRKAGKPLRQAVAIAMQHKQRTLAEGYNKNGRKTKAQ